MDCFRLQAALSVGILLAPQGIDTHRKRNDKADNNLLPERRYVEDIKAVADQRQKDRTDESPRYLAFAAGKRSSANHNGSNRAFPQ